MVMKHAPLVDIDIVLLKSSFATSISTVGVATAPGWLMGLPPTVNRVQLVLVFLGRSVHTNCQYVTSFMQSAGTSCWWMSLIVLVPLIHPPTP